MRANLLLAVFGCVVNQAVTAAGLPTTFDGARFARLSQSDRYDCVLSLLRWRESELDNFSYELVETFAIVADDGNVQPPFQRNEIEFQRIGSRSLFHSHSWSKGREWFEDWSAWDGKTRRSRTHRPERHYDAGTIADSEIELIRQKSYNQAIGYRMTDASRPMTRVEWLIDQVKVQNHALEIALDGEPASNTITVKVVLRPNMHQQFRLDPRRDFM